MQSRNPERNERNGTVLVYGQMMMTMQVKNMLYLLLHFYLIERSAHYTILTTISLCSRSVNG